jgi:hypothetical protein
MRNNEIIKILNYDVHQTNQNNEDHSGAAIAIRSNIGYKLLDNFHSDMIGAAISTREGIINIVTAYVPPRHNFIHYPDFHKIFTLKEPVYFLGDVNARHGELGHRDRNIRGELLVKLISRGHAHVIGPNFPTFINHRSSTSPDIIMANSRAFHNTYATPGKIITSSDHLYIIFTIASAPIQIPTKRRAAVAKADWATYRDILSSDLEVPAHATPQIIDRITNDWTNKIKAASDATIPKTSFRTLPHFKNNHRTRTLQVEYSALMAEIDTNGTSFDKHHRLNHLRYQIQTELRELAIDNWNQLIDKLDAETNPKTFWTSIKKLQGNETKTKAQYLLDHNAKKVYDDDKKETLFRNYWQKVFRISEEENAEFDQVTDRIVKQNIADHNEIITPYPTANPDRLTFQTTPAITLAELEESLKKTKQKAPGNSGITKMHLTNLPPIAKLNLVKIFNTILSSGYYPKVWKEALMIFLPKPGKTPLEHINYRPISLLEVPGKLLEKIINRRLIKTIENRGLYNSRQHGFRPNRGTNTATAILYETIATARGNDEKTEIILRDISRAFDKVWHDGLRDKIRRIQLPDCMTRLLCSYITDRTASIRIGDFYGPTFDIKSGVPQGGCLSPTLFNLYTHDLPAPLGPYNYISYADDITQIISYSGKSINMHSLITARAIAEVDSFENKWKIKTNVAKFQAISFGRTITKDIRLPNRTVQHTDIGTMLGLKLSNAGLSKHVTGRANSAKAQLTKLRRFRNLSEKNKRTLYLALVQSKLLYPTAPLNIINKTQLSRLQKVQNSGIRFITNTSLIDHIRTETLHDKVKIDSINLTLHKQAKKTWTTISNIFGPQFLDQFQLRDEKSYKITFPSSLRQALGRQPEQIYT